MIVTLLRNSPERVFCIMVEGLDTVPSIRWFNRTDDGSWIEFDGTDDNDLDNASSTPLNTEEASAFLRMISKDIPDVGDLPALSLHFKLLNMLHNKNGPIHRMRDRLSLCFPLLILEPQ